MTPCSKATLLPVFAALLVLLASGCGGGGAMQPVETISTDDYQIEVLAPGGAFKSGENPVALRLLRNGQDVNFRQGMLLFSRADSPDAPPAEAHLALDADSTALEGKVAFGLRGTWNGQVALVTETGPVTGSFQIEVH